MTQDYLELQYSQVRMACFMVGATTYAVDIKNVQEIIPLKASREIPRMPVFVEGMLTLRDAIYPVLDLRKLFLEEVTKSENNRILIYKTENFSMGFIVDEILQVINLDKSKLLPPPPVRMQGIPTGCLSKIFLAEEKSILVLDFTKILGERDKKALQQAAQSKFA